MKKPFILTLMVVGVLAEPPVNSRYLPPNSQNAGYPTTQYGAPSSAETLANFLDDNSLQSGYDSSSQYSSNSLSTEYGLPASENRRESQYSTPTQSAYRRATSSRGHSTSSRFSSAPSSLYSAPSRSVSSQSRFSTSRTTQSGQFNAPSSGRQGSPSTQYGAPSYTGRFGAPNVPSSQYGAPTPGSGRFGAASSPSTQYGAPSAGYDRNLLQEDDLAEPANYEFNFEVQDDEYGTQFGQEETRQDEKARGSYHVLLPDGRTLIVEYQADEEGYRPVIRYEEPSGGYPSSQRNQGGPY